MAAARSSARPDDPRVACSHCGGLIHPIAGRCKHCKTDLTAARSARPAAIIGLPSLGPVKQEPAAVIPLPMTAPNTVSQARASAVVPLSADESRPILPPRPTGRMEASGTTSRRATWPYVVIGLALAAIAVAVALLVIPHDDEKQGAGRFDPPPAPDRMSTDPKAATPDPWSAVPTPPGKGPLAQGTPTPAPAPTKPNPYAPDPVPPQGKVQPPDIDDLVVPDPTLGRNLRDPFNSSSTAMIVAMAKHACDRLTNCSKDAITSATCSALTSNMSGIAPPPTCAAARRCLAKIDQLSCDDLGIDVDDPFSPSFLSSMTMSLSDCMTAISC